MLTQTDSGLQAPLWKFASVPLHCDASAACSTGTLSCSTATSSMRLGCEGPLDTSENLGACPNSRCSNLRDSDSTFGYEQVFSSLEYRSNAAAAAERAGLRAERPCLAIYR